MKRFSDTLIVFSVFFLLLLGYLHPITSYTQDLGRHLTTGQLILDTLSVPKTNLYSYTYPDFPFINHHWLSEVLFSLVHTLSGDIGLQLLALILILLAFGSVYVTGLKKSSVLIASGSALLYLRILFERTDIRPELFSFLFLSIFLIILFSYRERYTKWIYFLLPLQLIWVNTHIYFFVGIVLLGLFLLDAIIVHRKNLNTTHTLTLGLVLVFAFLATLLNPNGLAGALYPLKVFQNYGYTIEENQTIFLLEQLGFHKPSLPYFKIAVLLLFLSLGVMWRKTRPIDWLLAITFSYAGMMAVRNLPLFVFTTFIPFCFALRHIVQTPIVQHYGTQKTYYVCALLLCCLFLWQGTVIAAMRPLGFGVSPGAERAASFFLENNLSGPIFNNFDIGSYLIYRLYPKEHVFIDGRPEAYPKDFIQNVYIPIQQSQEHFRQAERYYDFQTIFFSHTDQTPWANQFLKDIMTNDSWKIIYLDDTVIILAKNTQANETLINRFAMTSDTIKISHLDKNNRQSLVRLASFFNKSGLTNYELQMYQHLLTINPADCLALYSSGVLLQQKNDPGAQIFAARYQQACQN